MSQTSTPEETSMHHKQLALAAVAAIVIGCAASVYAQTTSGARQRRGALEQLP
jgi:hypothetical protein